MKKILIALIGLLILSGCQSKIETTVCTNTLYEPITVEREISLQHRDNIIVKVESVETFTLTKDFSEKMFLTLEATMLERHKDSKNLSFKSSIENNVAKMFITLNNIDEATTIELMLIGINKDDADNVPGLKETIRFNEQAGYICKLKEN